MAAMAISLMTVGVIMAQQYDDYQAEKQEEIERAEAENDQSQEVQQVHQETQWFTVESTAYTALCDSGCTGITATGYDVRNTIYYDGLRIIAVDPDVIPLHSIVEIDTGNRLIHAIALDTGGAIQGNRIDLLVDTKDEAFQFGRRDVKVRVVE